MEEYSRPATLEDLKTLVHALNQHGAAYLLIGGNTSGNPSPRISESRTLVQWAGCLKETRLHVSPVAVLCNRTGSPVNPRRLNQ